MRKELIVTSTKDMSREDWLLFRKRGVGASDMGTILGLNQYKANIELFYERIGAQLDFSLENIAMFMGREQEDFMANLWEYWGGTVESMIANFRNNEKQRRCQRVNAYVQNPKWPWIYVSLDRKINKTATRGEGALELKTIAGYEANKWEAEIPPGHIVQVQTQILTCEFEFGELATLRDGRAFDVYPFDPVKGIHEAIIEQSHDFWQRVERGRKILTQQYAAKESYNQARVDDLQGQLEELEPAPDGSEAYEKFLKKKFQFAKPGLVNGSEEDFQDARAHLALKAQKKDLEANIREKENILKRRIGEGSTLDFGKRGKITWEGEPRRFYNRIKE